MLEECVTYDSNTDLQTLCDECEMYVGRLFSIRVMNLDGVFAPGYYTAIMIRYEDSVGFLIMFDDSKKFYLNKFQFVELQYVTSYTLFTDNDKIWYDRFMPYLNSSIVSDFMSRMETKNGDVSISVDDNSIMTIKQKPFEVVFG